MAMMADDLANRLRGPVYALLRLSDLVCQRAGLARYQLGSDRRSKVLPASVLNTLSTWAEIVSFTEADFKEHGIALEHLVEFEFPVDRRAMLPHEAIGNSTLERFPIVHRNGEFCLLLPTATSAARLGRCSSPTRSVGTWRWRARSDFPRKAQDAAPPPWWPFFAIG